MDLRRRPKKAAMVETRFPYPIGATLDVINGHIMYGTHGETYIMGGAYALPAVIGVQNTLKSTLSLYMALLFLIRYSLESVLYIYDSELTMREDRIDRLANELGYEGSICDDGRVIIIRGDEQLGDDFFADQKQFAKDKIQAQKSLLRKTELVDNAGNQILCLVPTRVLYDSITKLSLNVTEKTRDENGLGDKGGNMLYMEEGRHKKRLINEHSGLARVANHYCQMTAHLQPIVSLDPYKPKTKRLKFIKGDLEIKGCPEDIEFLATDIYQTISSKALLISGSKEPEYGNEGLVKGGSTNLVEVELGISRSKSGPTGPIKTIIAHQTAGIKHGLTCLNAIRKNKYYGLGGSNTKFYPDLYPAYSVTRNSVQAALDNDPKFLKAVEFTSEMMDIFEYWDHLDPKYFCTPKELHDNIKELGYDWDVLLQTRNYPVIESLDENGKVIDRNLPPPLSTYDLLRMRVGEYHPFWLKENPQGSMAKLKAKAEEITNKIENIIAG